MLAYLAVGGTPSSDVLALQAWLAVTLRTGSIFAILLTGFESIISRSFTAVQALVATPTGAAASTAPESPALVVAHLSPASVAEMPEYRAWMAACGPSTQHVMVSHMAPGAGSPMLQSSARIHARLNVLAPSVFPLLPDTPDARPAADAGALLEMPLELTPIQLNLSTVTLSSAECLVIHGGCPSSMLSQFVVYGKFQFAMPLV